MNTLSETQDPSPGPIEKCDQCDENYNVTTDFKCILACDHSFCFNCTVKRVATLLLRFELGCSVDPFVEEKITCPSCSNEIFKILVTNQIDCRKSDFNLEEITSIYGASVLDYLLFSNEEVRELSLPKLKLHCTGTDPECVSQTLVLPFSGYRLKSFEQHLQKKHSLDICSLCAEYHPQLANEVVFYSDNGLLDHLRNAFIHDGVPMQHYKCSQCVSASPDKNWFYSKDTFLIHFFTKHNSDYNPYQVLHWFEDNPNVTLEEFLANPPIPRSVYPVIPTTRNQRVITTTNRPSTSSLIRRRSSREIIRRRFAFLRNRGRSVRERFSRTRRT
ncbi:Succinate-semialdehyde dehydrogenase [Sarcoptes scabiei]|nr:Succinate-semialdehyde dehydrogenase [Sarcoptes scabiei]